MYDHDTKYASTLEFTFQFKERATSMPSPDCYKPEYRCYNVYEGIIKQEKIMKKSWVTVRFHGLLRTVKIFLLSEGPLSSQMAHRPMYLGDGGESLQPFRLNITTRRCQAKGLQRRKKSVFG